MDDEGRGGGSAQGEMEWQGRRGEARSPGEYTWKVVVNRSKYENIGTIGNTGQPPTTSGHVPVYLEGVAVDAKDGIYTVHDWDEAHFSVIKWSPKDGRAEFNTGNAVNEALLKGIAVEPDGSYAYVTGYQDHQRSREVEICDLADQAGSGQGQLEGRGFFKGREKDPGVRRQCANSRACFRRRIAN